ncbi:adenylate/guanylate cyclase domain-containing protein [Anoxybacterium hadale]|uniref:Adenylate/guanylate cyclase domain-containing protein n=1 Tax=Anoxybacterium hadale TaxID=3408580 RepID=A0ACD1AC03_9FIRM|nr:adenylate/guanylate cyclase domain-containing protein [Clostridiales bacterium]
MESTIKSFSEIYKTVYDLPGISDKRAHEEMQKFMNEASSTGLGHPAVSNIQLGETLPGSIVVFFMDIRGFTKMSIALGNEELIKILQAITAASIISIKQYGGYVIEFTGDGVMAYFGQGLNTTERDAFNALKTCAFLMNGIKEVVNQYLNKLLDETVRVGMGIEHGNTLWTRIGSKETNQVKPVSEVSFIAGKNSSHAKPWEVVMGKNIATWIPDRFKGTYDSYSFQKNGEKYTYERSTFNWESFFTEYCQNVSDLEKSLFRNKLPVLSPRVISNDGLVAPVIRKENANPGPRPLKDQPFFG